MKAKAYIYAHPESECAWYQLIEDNTGFDGLVELLFIADAEEMTWAVSQDDWQHCATHHGAYGQAGYTWHGVTRPW